MKNKLTGIFLLFLCILVLVACGKKEKGPGDGNRGERLGFGENKGGVIVREDAKGIIKITIEDGEANISFDLDKCEEFYQLSEYPEYYNVDGIREGPFKIRVISGRVKDAFVGELQIMDYSELDFTVATVVLTMEDGSVEWVYADPFSTIGYSHYEEEYSKDGNFESYRALAYKDNFTSFSYENHHEDQDAMVLYLINDKGEKFDFYKLWLETKLTQGSWVMKLEDDFDEDISPYLYLKFEPHGTFTLDVAGSYMDYEIAYYHENWGGSYEIDRGSSKNYYMGSFDFDLHLLWWIDEGDNGLKTELSGSYSFETDSTGDISLVYESGDRIYQRGNMEVFPLVNIHDDLEEFRGQTIEGMAILEFSRYLADGMEFIVVWVEAIEDLEEANDYRIENEDVGYYQFTTATYDQYSLMEYDKDGFVDRVDYYLTDFINEVRNSYRDGRVLANIVVEDGHIISAHEVYQP